MCGDGPHKPHLLSLPHLLGQARPVALAPRQHSRHQLAFKLGVLSVGVLQGRTRSSGWAGVMKFLV